MKLDFDYNVAGLFCIIFTTEHEEYNCHFLVKKPYRLWGKEDHWWDGPIIDIGLGPLFLLCIRYF